MNAYDHVEKASELKNEANDILGDLIKTAPGLSKWLVRLLEITTEIDRLVEEVYLDAKIEGEREGAEEARRECEDNHSRRAFYTASRANC